MSLSVNLVACFSLSFLANVGAQHPTKSAVTFKVPEKDRACIRNVDFFMDAVRLGNYGGKLAWRSNVLGKQVQAEGVAWAGQRILMEGNEIRLKGCEYSKQDQGKLVRVVGTLRYDGGSWSRFGTVPPYFFIQTDSYTVIDRVKQPVLICYDEDVTPISAIPQKSAKK